MRLLCVLVMAVLPMVASGQIELLKDINNNADFSGDSNPQSFTNVGNATFFSATTPDRSQLYKTRGASADIVPSGRASQFLKAFNNRLFFVGLPTGINATIWSTNDVEQVATPAVTFPFAGIDTMIVHGNELYVALSSPFIGNSPSFSHSIWKTDGTQAGTSEIRNFLGTGKIENMTSVGTKVYFTFDDIDHGKEIWVTDGTSAGTAVIDYVAGTTGGDYSNLADGGDGLLYFNLSQQILMRSNGTLAGTFNIFTGSATQKPSPVIRVNNKIYFSTFRDIWTTNGTAVGTTLVKQMANSPQSIRSLINFHDSLYFIGPDAFGGTDIWKSNGTTVGTITAGLSFDPKDYLTIHDDSLFFVAFGGSGDRLIKTNGTQAGTKSLFFNADFGEITGPLYDAGAYIYFPFRSPGLGAEPWVIDTMTGAVYQLKNINISPGGSNILNSGGVALNNRFIFGADDGVNGSELWITDGTTDGTNLLKDLLPGNAGASPKKFFVHGNEVYFTARTANADGSVGGPPDAVWKTDGTTQGTVHIKDILIEDFFVLNNIVHFFGRSENSYDGNFLYTTNGTSAGTIPVFSNPPFGIWPTPPVVLDNIAYFNSQVIGMQFRPGITDGTEAGTVSLLQVSQQIIEFVVVDDMVFYYTVNDMDRLWMIQGSTPVLMHEFDAGTIRGIQAAGNNLLVYVVDSGVWVSDGTEVGTTLFAEGSAYLVNDRNSILGSQALIQYSSETTNEGAEVWKTDGVNLTLVKDIAPNLQTLPEYFATNGSAPQFLASHQGRVFFQTNSIEQWVSRGTAETTMRVAPSTDLLITKMYPLGDKIIIAGSTDDFGEELYVLDMNYFKNGQVISFTTDTDVAYGDAPYNLTGSTTAALPVTFVSSDPSIIKIVGNQAQIVGVGDVTITASQAGNNDFSPAPDVTIEVEVKRGTPVISFTLQPTATYGDADIALVATSTAPQPIAFISANPDIAQVNGSTLKILKAGFTLISAVQDETALYTDAIVQVSIDIKKAAQTITFPEIGPQTFGNGDLTLVATASSGLPVTFIAPFENTTIVGNKATFKSPGISQISASQAGNENYLSAPSVAYLFCVNPPKPVLTFTNNVITSSSATGNKWYRNGVAIVETKNFINVTESAEYKVQVSAGGCDSEFSEPLNAVFVGLEDEKTVIAIAPNPATDFIYVSVDLAEDSTPELLSVVGQAFDRKVFNKIQPGQYRADVRELRPGTYIVRVTSQGVVHNKRVIIVH